MSDHDFPCLTNPNARIRLQQPVQDGSNQRQGFWGTLEPHRIGGRERLWRHDVDLGGDNANHGRAQRVDGNSSQVMQSAAFILDISKAVTMVAVTAQRAVVVRAGDSGLIFEGMNGVVQHQRDHACNLGDQEQPKEPRTNAVA
jgi:hypothetical protein